MYHLIRTTSRKLGAAYSLLLALCVFAFAAPSAWAQTGTATGTVIDTSGEPLPGASVVVLDTKLGGITDLDGNFAISGVKPGATIRVAFVGYKPATAKWEGQPLSFTLGSDDQLLNEVVVVGFGQQKKVNLTGAVSTVSSKELTNRPVNSVADALQGLVPGLDVLSAATGGQLNGTRPMEIRGTGTLSTGASVVPLVLIDGMEGALETVNPQDVENISVLKDASASSIYGSRAAGGVILVTTRKAKEGRVSVTYSDSFRWSHNIRMPKKMDSYNYAVMMNEGSVNSGGSLWLPEAKVEQIRQYMENPTGPSMFRNPSNNRWEVWDVVDIIPIANVDYLQEHFGKTPFSQEHNLSVNGGSEKVNYLFSASVLDQEGILRYGDDNLRRYTVNGRSNVKLNNWATFGYSTRWYRNEYNGPSLIGDNGSNQFYHDVMRYWNLIPVTDPNGHYVRETYIPALTEGGRYKKTTEQIDQQFSLRLTPIKGMNVVAEANYRSGSENGNRTYLQTYSYDCDNNPYANKASAMPTNSSVTQWNYKTNYFNPNVYADYSFTLDDAHNFKVMAGFQAEWLNRVYTYASRTNVINDIPWINTTDGTPTVQGDSNTWSTAGWFGRLNYDYKGRYLFEGNLRYDGTSRFRAGSRWSWSPSFSLGWNVANEAFFEDYSAVVNTLKFRGSWGMLGNQNTNSWYPTYTTMGYTANAGGWLIDGKKPTIASMPGLVSSTLTWEKNRTWDVGADIAVLNGRLNGTFDYYQRKTYDMVGPGPDLPDVLGATVPPINSVSMTSKGWELSISWRDRIQDFSYGITASLSDYMITIDDYANNPSKSLNIAYYTGMKLGEIWGFETEGIAKTQAEMDAHLEVANQDEVGWGWSAGDIMYKDTNGDGAVTYGEYTADNSGDWHVIGNSTPRYQFGLTLDAQWKGFDARVFFSGVGKRDYWASGAVFWGPCSNNQWQAAALEQHLDYFRPEGTTNPLGANTEAYYPRPNWGGGWINTEVQTRYLQNAAYGRLKNVTIGYTIPKAISQKAYLENFRIYVSGENLATITKFTGTGDPELINAYDNAYGYGKVYPLSRVLSFGLNVTF